MPLDIQITRTMSIVFLTFESALIFQKPKKRKEKVKREINCIHTNSRTVRCQMFQVTIFSTPKESFLFLRMPVIPFSSVTCVFHSFNVKGVV